MHSEVCLAHSLMESIEQMLPPVWGPLAARLGETQYGVKRGLEAAVASMIESLAQRSGDLPFMTRIRLLAGEAERPWAMAAAASAGAQPAPRGARFLTVALGGRRAETAASVARIANVSPVSADAILTAAAPLLMEALAERVRDDATDAEAFASLLGSEAGAVGGYLIPPTVSQPAAREGKGVGAALALSAIGLLLTAGLWWWSGRDRPPTPHQSGPGTELPTVSPLVTPAAGDFYRRELPGGGALRLLRTGVENRLLAFIEDQDEPADTAEWFTLDADPEPQIANIAAILKAYPTVKLAVGGPEPRATVDRLVQLGVAPGRLFPEIRPALSVRVAAR